MPSIIDETSQKLARELKTTEPILWWGQPEIKLFSWPDLIIIPFMCIWSYMPITAIGCGIKDFLLHGTKPDPFMFLFMSMFAFIGLYMLVGRFIHEYIKRRLSYFIITPSRAVVISMMWPKTKQSIDFNEIKQISAMRYPKKQNAGMIMFGESSLQTQTMAMNNSMAGLSRFNNMRNMPIFYDVADINKPLEMLKDNLKDKNVSVNEITLPSIVDIYKQLSQAELLRKEQLKSQKTNPELIQTDSAPANLFFKKRDTVESTEMSTDEKEESIAMQRRLYIGRSLGMFVGVIFAFIFSYNCLGIYKQQAKLALEGQNWPSTKGKIKKIEIIRSKGEPYLRSFKVNFAVEGKDYMCEKYSYSDYSDESKAQEYDFGNTHKKGDVVDVYYDPKDPENSVLQCHADLGDRQEHMAKGFFYMGVLVLMVIIGRLILYPLKTFAPKVLKEQSLSGVVFLAAFLSVWATFFFGAILTSALEQYIRCLPPMPFQ